MQFFFTVDVITMMTAAFREKKWIKVTVILAALLAAMLIGGILFTVLFEIA